MNMHYLNMTSKHNICVNEVCKTGYLYVLSEKTRFLFSIWSPYSSSSLTSECYIFQTQKLGLHWKCSFLFKQLLRLMNSR